MPINGNGQAGGNTYAVSLLSMAYEFDLHPAALVTILRERGSGEGCDTKSALLSVSHVDSIEEVNMWLALQIGAFAKEHGESILKCDACRMIFEPFDDIQAEVKKDDDDADTDRCPWCSSDLNMTLAEALDVAEVEDDMDYVIAGDVNGPITANG